MNSTQEDIIIPAFLKFFDPYAVLEPEKVGKSTDNQNNDSNQDVSGSLITLKKDANVVDVFENLFVTPQQVSRNGNNNGFDEEFANFLDKYEERKVGKLIDICESKPNSMKLYADEDIKVLEPKLVINENIDEDLIDELILEDSIEHLCLKETADNITSFTKTVPDNNLPSKIDHEKNINNTVRDVFATNFIIKVNKKPNEYTNRTTQADSSMEPSRLDPNNSEIKISHILTKQNIPKPSIIRENSHKCKVFIDTVVKNPRVFKKQRKVKSEAEVFNYTTGAGLQEKSVVLPLIMERLTNRNIAREMKHNLQNKLLLDTDITVATKENDISANEFTYRREMKRKQMEDFLNHQKIGNLSVNLDEYQILDASTSKNIYNRDNDNSLLKKSNNGCSQHKTNNTHDIFTSDVKQNILSTRNLINCHNEASTSKINEDHTMNSTQGNTKLPSKFFDPYAVLELVKVWGKSKIKSQSADSVQDISGSLLTVKNCPNIGNDKKPHEYSKHTSQVDSNMAPTRAIQNNNEPNISHILAKQNISTPTTTRENLHKCKVFIETVSKDPKIFKKRRLVKSEKETSKYTKGASLAEKNVVLPQIMERLINRNIAHEKKNNLQKKLLLDTGVTVASKVNDTSDNKFTHRGEIKRKQMEEFINQQQIGVLNLNLDEHQNDTSTSKNINDRNNNNVLFNKSNLGASEHKPINANKVFTSDIQQYILSTMNAKDYLNGASTSKINVGSKEIGSKNEILYPEVLMEDCNRQRLIEFQRRRLFQNFVCNGKSD